MRLLHYSSKPFVPFGSERRYPQNMARDGTGKPQGLWLSVEGEDDWAHWCASEMPEWVSGRVVTEIVLKPDHGVLCISNLEQFDKFCEDYKYDDCDAYSFNQIDWPVLSKRHAGIIIAPYRWERRLERKSRWYYGWDCASGCIWDLNVIEECKEAGVHEALVQDR